MLAIGRRSRHLDEVRLPDGAAKVQLLRFDELVARHDALHADLVLSPMVGDTFDCLDVAVHLHAHGFRGRLHVVAPALPDPAILRREVASICPGIQVDVVIQDGDDAAPGVTLQVS